MPLFLFSLLQTPVTLNNTGISPGTIVGWLISSGISLFVLFKNINRADSKELQEKLKHFEQEIAKHGLLHQASQQERERLVDNANQRFQTLETRVSQVDQVLTKVTLLEAKLETQNNQIEKLEKVIEKLDYKFDKVLEELRSKK